MVISVACWRGGKYRLRRGQRQHLLHHGWPKKIAAEQKHGQGGQHVESRRSAGGSLPRWSSADGSKEGEGKLHVRVMCVIASML